MNRIDRRTFLALTSGAAGVLVARPALPGTSPPTSAALTALTLHEASEGLRKRNLSSLELTQACLQRVEQYDSRIYAFVTVTSKVALAQAAEADKAIRRGRRLGPLHGIPFAVKDSIDTAGIPTTFARTEFRDRIPAQDAEVVRRLKQAGAVLLGKLNLPGGTGGFTKTVRNPRALDRDCAYTSSGSAAAVAADFCFGAVGTDGGGSVRLPAAACGVVGLKPTYGLVSNLGLASYNALSHVGPLSKTVFDAALLLQVMAGHDPRWRDSAQVPLPSYVAALASADDPPRVGILQGDFLTDLEPGVVQPVEEALATVREIARAGYVSLDASAYRARLHDYIRDPAAELFPELALRAIRDNAVKVFTDGVEFLVAPTWKREPMNIEALERILQSSSQQQVERDVWNTWPFNILGLPAISVPCGYTKSGLPVGLQIIGKPFAEARLLAFAHAFERAMAPRLNKPDGELRTA